MDLDRSYFNSIRLNTHRGKYYDVEAVDRLLVDIRSRADSLNKGSLPPGISLPKQLEQQIPCGMKIPSFF